MLEDTIIAVSTPAGYGGLGIVRLSGKKALSIAKRFFQPKKDWSKKVLERRLIFGNIHDDIKKEPLDEAYLAFFPGPRSYTREDVVEISCHGSPIILEEIVRLGIRAGARLAGPGEFTLRAYLHGRLDILQAEAVNDIIMATSLQQAKISFGQLEGKLSRRIKDLRRKIVGLLSQIEASIEFPEEDMHLSPKQIAKSLEAAISSLKRLIATYEAGRTMTEGLNLAIVGKANVGKSTLFNALLEQERAIVSPYPGTTRDYLREIMRVKDSLFHLIDMAGMERPSHPVEEAGIRRGREMAARADGILLLLDSSRPERTADLRLIKKFRGKKLLLLFNKSDLPPKIDKEKCRTLSNDSPWLEISALKSTNLERLKEMIHQNFVPETGAEEDTILHLRQKLQLEEIMKALENARRLLEEGYSEEVWVEEIRASLPLIGNLTGEIRVDEIIETIFKRFCVGK